ncbi:MAG: class I SAM-dependent methyltransferase [Actinomycetota bacterium]
MEIDVGGSWKARLLSPATLALHQAMVPRLRRQASGRLLDVGCGVMPFRRYVDRLVSTYHASDREARVPDLDFLSDVQSRLPIRPNTYDLVLCSQVLEHVPDPSKAIAEMARVLRPSGVLVLSAPHLSRLHEEPFDYYRFTRHALVSLLEHHGFEELEIVPAGSLFSFLGHQLSSILVSSSWRVPILRQVVFWLNALLVTFPCNALDSVLPGRRRLPLNYVVIARRGRGRGGGTSANASLSSRQGG